MNTFCAKAAEVAATRVQKPHEAIVYSPVRPAQNKGGGAGVRDVCSQSRADWRAPFVPHAVHTHHMARNESIRSPAIFTSRLVCRYLTINRPTWANSLTSWHALPQLDRDPWTALRASLGRRVAVQPHRV